MSINTTYVDSSPPPSSDTISFTRSSSTDPFRFVNSVAGYPLEHADPCCWRCQYCQSPIVQDRLLFVSCSCVLCMCLALFFFVFAIGTTVGALFFFCWVVTFESARSLFYGLFFTILGGALMLLFGSLTLYLIIRYFVVRSKVRRRISEEKGLSERVVRLSERVLKMNIFQFYYARVKLHFLELRVWYCCDECMNNKVLELRQEHHEVFAPVTPARSLKETSDEDSSEAIPKKTTAKKTLRFGDAAEEDPLSPSSISIQARDAPASTVNHASPFVVSVDVDDDVSEEEGVSEEEEESGLEEEEEEEEEGAEVVEIIEEVVESEEEVTEEEEGEEVVEEVEEEEEEEGEVISGSDVDSSDEQQSSDDDGGGGE